MSYFAEAVFPFIAAILSLSYYCDAVTAFVVVVVVVVVMPVVVVGVVSVEVMVMILISRR